MAGNQSKYCEEVHRIIVDAIADGVTRGDAFRLAGLHVDTGFDWLRAGRKWPEKYPQYVQLGADIDEAEAEARRKMTEVIVNSAQAAHDPRVSLDAAKVYLERRDPDNWGRREKHTIEGGDTPLVQLTQVVLNDGDAREASRALLRRATGLSTGEPLGLGMGDELAPIDGEVEVDSR